MAERTPQSRTGIPSDAAVIKDVLLGDTDRFGVLFDRYAKKVFGYLWYFSRNRADCEDFLQDTFYKAYVNLRRCRERDKFSSWLFAIAHNVAVSHSTKLAARHAKEVTGDQFVAALDVASPDDLNLELVRQENRRTVREVVRDMPAHYRSAVILFYFNELSLQEISAALDIPVNTVKTRLRRGRQFIAERLRHTPGGKDLGLVLVNKI